LIEHTLNALAEIMAILVARDEDAHRTHGFIVSGYRVIHEKVYLMVVSRTSSMENWKPVGVDPVKAG